MTVREARDQVARCKNNKEQQRRIARDFERRNDPNLHSYHCGLAHAYSAEENYWRTIAKHWATVDEIDNDPSLRRELAPNALTRRGA